jgi:diadenosine tetraphosphate (Ap4A) HIT family hydrolase
VSAHITRDQAIERVAAERQGEPCLVCAMRDGKLGTPHVIARGQQCRVVLARYAVRRGHALVLLDQHVTRFADVDDAAWAEATALALSTARRIERALSPVRCYVASLGSVEPDLPMSSPHLHLHVVPIYEPDDKPSRVLTWAHGVIAASDAELAELAAVLRDQAPART